MSMKDQKRGRSLSLSAEERDDFLRAARTCRVATISAGGPHVSPLWFLWHGGSLWLYSISSSQRFKDLQRDPRIAVVVDDGTGFEELRGVEMVGTARVVGEVPRSGERYVEELVEVEAAYARKYQDRPTLRYDGRHAWIAVSIDKFVSWDFRKMKREG